MLDVISRVASVSAYSSEGAIWSGWNGCRDVARCLLDTFSRFDCSRAESQALGSSWRFRLSPIDPENDKFRPTPPAIGDDPPYNRAMILSCFVFAWVGALAQASPLGNQPREFVSKAAGVRMAFPNDWTVTVDETHRPPKDEPEVSDYYKNVLLDAYDAKDSDVEFCLSRADPEDTLWMRDYLLGHAWTDPSKLHLLPNDYQRDKSYWVIVGGRPAYVTSSSHVTFISQSIRWTSVQATIVDTKQRCYWLYLQYMEPGADEKSSTKEVDEVMKREYPVFISMLKSITFNR